MQPGIKIDQDSIAYNQGIQRNIFLKKNEKNEIVFGKNSYKQSTHYPDYFHPSIQDYKNDVYGYLFQDIGNRGCFLVDNEITDYSTQQNPSDKLYLFSNNHKLLHKKVNLQIKEDNKNKNLTSLTQLPYIPGNRSLEENTLNITYLHYNNVREVYSHNIFSLMQTYSAYQYQHKLAGSPFPFIVSKSTSPGFGQYGAHLVEQPGCDWKSLQLSLSNMLNFNQGTGSLIKPLFFDFPNDELLYKQETYLNEQFLVGQSLMVTPIFELNKQTIYPYFPQDSWFDFHSGEQIKKESQQASVEEVKNNKDELIPIFMRGGTIVPLQTGYDSSKHLQDQTTDYDLLIAFKILEDGTMYAEGDILGKTVFSDSSIFESCIKENCLIKVQVYSQTVVVRPPEKSKYKVNIVFDTIIPFIKIDTIQVRNLILILEQRRVVYLANYAISGKIEFNFSVTP